jgi:hypothetical protein
MLCLPEPQTIHFLSNSHTLPKNSQLNYSTKTSNKISEFDVASRATKAFAL